MRRALIIQWAVAIALSIAPLAAHAQKRPASEAEALIYIESAFITQADPGLLKPNVAVGPELQKKLSLPAAAKGDKVYEAVTELVGDKPFAVRKAERDEVELYGLRRGFDPSLRQPLFVVVAGNSRFLLQYDLQALQVSYIGELGLLDPEPRPVAAPPPIPIVTAAARPGAKPGASSLAWTAQFEYGSFKLTLHSQVFLETEVLPTLKRAKEVRYLNVSGHADRMGSAEYNQRLSEKRAEALKAWLVERGVDADKIETFGYGKTLPVKSCREEKGQALVECLAPNRRVVIELQAAVTP
jgi:outer membrane protein OmpA-like peptidoglycan-associated protein